MDEYLSEMILEIFEEKCGDEFFALLLRDVNNDSLKDKNYIEFINALANDSLLLPPYKRLALQLVNWIYHFVAPTTHIIDHVLVVNQESFKGVYNEIEDMRKTFNELCNTPKCHVKSCMCYSHKLFQVRQFLLKLTKFDILKILGLQRTMGSVERIPPDLYTLWLSFQKINKKNSILSVGARALSKHCHRSQDNWWGAFTGTEKEKNQLAIKVLIRILNDISWINIHVLPHDKYVFEIRCTDGFGVRWSHDGNTFRGFLEPQMMAGHEKRWKH